MSAVLDMARPKLLPRDENGRIIGEAHHRARLTNHEVDLIRELREEHRMTYAQLAAMYSVPKSTIQMICSYKRRASTATQWRPVKKREAA